MATLIEQVIEKLGLRDEPDVLAKTTELVRLLELRSTNVPLQVSDYGKIVLCAHLAAEQLDVPLDTEHALKLSSLRKSQYTTNKRMFEKLLHLTKIVGVRDICIQLGVEEVTKKAQEILELYRKNVADGNPDIDIIHPQYAAMSVFYACKLCKRKLGKTKLMPFSNLRPQQFQQLELRWEKFMTKHYSSGAERKPIKPPSLMDGVNENKPPSTTTTFEMKSKFAVEDYELWKERVLAKAQQRLAEFAATKAEREKENQLAKTDS